MRISDWSSDVCSSDLWDENDCLVLCNEAYRSFYPEFADGIVIGMSFDELQSLIQTYRFDLPGQDGEVREAWLAQRQEMHRAGSMTGEFRHVNGNILRISERTTRARSEERRVGKGVG